MLYRERRSWTEEEDQLLRDAVDLEEPGSNNPSKWHAIAKHVPSRTNKDCRKRWFAKMASDVVKGGWAPEEDEKLVQAIEKYGTRWSLVSAYVQTRNSDQCAKRWTDTLNPIIDRTQWSAEADALLLSAVQEHGKFWTRIVRMYFPGRTGLAAKNRYNSITRFNTRASRRKSCKPRFRSESGSSTSSNSPNISSASDTSEPLNTPPSFELNAPLILTNLEGVPSELMFDPTMWSPTESLTCLPSPGLTYEDLCRAMTSPSDIISSSLEAQQIQSSISTPWESLSMDETYSQIQHAIGLYSDSAFTPLESFDAVLSYQDLGHPNPACSPLPLSPISDTSTPVNASESSTVLQSDEDTSRYSTVAFWDLPTPTPNSLLAQWTSTY
ncbi:hypothetical protein J3R30DRAFT_3694243 [Lentinula aciculospora]|uniref:Uncharacterized protein n=1 Tax=Lentinula aciculospora TaxID=153920 RepID=A0A9W9DX40_9AGAR|nr:hypothetical protein J3R30DRAFT_3694243 [Lentinula aciculospora]